MRPVLLYTVPALVSVTDLQLRQVWEGAGLGAVLLEWEVTVSSLLGHTCTLELSYGGQLVTAAPCATGGLLLESPVLWWPRGAGQPVLTIVMQYI